MAEKEIDAKGTGNGGQNIKEPAEPKIYESGYFYLSQQINDLRDRMDAKFDRVDAKFEAVHKEIKDLSDKTDARFEANRKETDARFDKVEDKFDALNKWAIGSVIAVLIGTISVIATLLLK